MNLLLPKNLEFNLKNDIKIVVFKFLSIDRNSPSYEIIHRNLSIYFFSRMKNSFNILCFSQWLLVSIWCAVFRKTQPDKIGGHKWLVMSTNGYGRHLHVVFAMFLFKEDVRGMSLLTHSATYQVSSIKSLRLPRE